VAATDRQADRQADKPGESALADRLAALERRVARLESAGGRGESGEPGGSPGADAFWALEGLRQRAGQPGAVLFAGTVSLPGGEHYEWQWGQPVKALLADDWSELAGPLDAVAHPVRLLLLHRVLHGVRTAAELGEHERLGTSGQLYHHLRQLVAAGWLRSTVRGQYAVPPERVVPLLVLLSAARR
jgi:DNA-binding transcriptional ArsR family regulator